MIEVKPTPKEITPPVSSRVQSALESYRDIVKTRRDYVGILALLEACPSEAHLDMIKEKCDGIGGGDIGPEFLGFIEDYIHYAAIIGGHIDSERAIVVDVGCAYGFQHVLFQDCLAYVGIDLYSDGIAGPPLTANAQFWQGDFASDEIQGQLADFILLKTTELKAADDAAAPGRNSKLLLPGHKTPPRVYGIANMSILYAPDVQVSRSLEAMHRCFKRMFIL